MCACVCVSVCMFGVYGLEFGEFGECVYMYLFFNACYVCLGLGLCYGLGFVCAWTVWTVFECVCVCGRCSCVRRDRRGRRR